MHTHFIVGIRSGWKFSQKLYWRSSSLSDRSWKFAVNTILRLHHINRHVVKNNTSLAVYLSSFHTKAKGRSLKHGHKFMHKNDNKKKGKAENFNNARFYNPELFSTSPASPHIFPLLKGNEKISKQFRWIWKQFGSRKYIQSRIRQEYGVFIGEASFCAAETTIFSNIPKMPAHYEQQLQIIADDLADHLPLSNRDVRDRVTSSRFKGYFTVHQNGETTHNTTPDTVFKNEHTLCMPMQTQPSMDTESGSSRFNRLHDATCATRSDPVSEAVESKMEVFVNDFDCNATINKESKHNEDFSKGESFHSRAERHDQDNLTIRTRKELINEIRFYLIAHDLICDSSTNESGNAQQRDRLAKLRSELFSLPAPFDCTQPHTWFPLARKIKRKIIIHSGPTNSGKTYRALQGLIKAKSGIYMAPLRLLAWEQQQRLCNAGIPTTLLTGQERIIVPESSHVAATIEMAQMDTHYDVCVIDECQMLGDPTRGVAWTRALLGVQAETVYVIEDGSATQLVKDICRLTGDTVEHREHNRLSPLFIEKKPLRSFANIQPGDCVVAFSRRQIFDIKAKIEAVTGLRCAVVYGGLPPESRREQATLFNDSTKNYPVLVASDAIGMGLNLNIRRIIFSTLVKFDGDQVRALHAAEIRQIAGRAGRYGLDHAAGLVTALRQRDWQSLHRVPRLESTELLKLNDISKSKASISASQRLHLLDTDEIDTATPVDAQTSASVEHLGISMAVSKVSSNIATRNTCTKAAEQVHQARLGLELRAFQGLLELARHPPKSVSPQLEPILQRLITLSTKIDLALLLDILVDHAAIHPLFCFGDHKDFRRMAEELCDVPLSLSAMYDFCHVPVQITKAGVALRFVKRFAQHFAAGKRPHLKITERFNVASTPHGLAELEELYSIFDSYIWLAYRFGESTFPSLHDATKWRKQCSEAIDASIQNMTQTRPAHRKVLKPSLAKSEIFAKERKTFHNQTSETFNSKVWF